MVIPAAFLLFAAGPGLAAENSPPVIQSFTPASGSSQPGQQVKFTAVYSDPDGASSIRLVYLKFSAGSGSGFFYGIYRQDLDKLYIKDDSGQWTGGYAPGSAQTIENSYTSLDCSQTTATAQGQALTLNWAITFKPPFSGYHYPVYLYAQDYARANSGWQKKGTWLINQPPQADSITPSSGLSLPGEEVMFETTCSDPDGSHTLYGYLFKIYAKHSPHYFYGFYKHTTGLLYIHSPSSGWIGGVSPGSAQTLETDAVKLDCAKTSVQAEAEALTVRWALTFKPPASGRAYRAYLYARDLAVKVTGWQKKATWLINQLPQCGTLTPSQGKSTAGQQASLTTTHIDPDGAANLKTCGLQIYTGSGSVFFLGAYRQDLNKLYIKADSGSWTGGYAPGSARTLENSYASLDCSQTSVTPAGQALTLNWAITFKDSFSNKVHPVYLYTQDLPGFNTGWEEKGSWEVTTKDTTPPEITYTQPDKYAKFYEGDTIQILANVTDTDPSPLEYQFSVDENIIQPWNPVPSYNWLSNTTIGNHTIEIEARDLGGEDCEEIPIYILRRPIGPPDL